MRGYVLLAVSIVVVGCDSGGPRFAPISGTILVDGKPVKNLRIAFSPIGSMEKPFPGPPSSARTDEEGRFQLRSSKDRQNGAVVGPARVYIEYLQAIDFTKLPRPDVKRLPARYNDQTTLTFEVPSEGTDLADFQLSWK